MVFKNIDGQLTSVFNKTQKVNSGFAMTGEEISDIVGRFNKLNLEQNTNGLIKFYDGIETKNANVADMFRDVAKQGATAQASIKGVYAAILDGNTTGLGNVKSIIDKFNSLSDTSHQKDFAKAVGQTNSQLGRYLSNVQTGSANIFKYGKQVAAATAKTIGLRVATIALNTALNFGISLLISSAITALSNYINKQKEMKEAQEEEIKNSKELVSNLKKENSTLEETIRKYSELGNKTTLTSSEKDNLLSLQEEIIDTYGREANGLDLVNGKYENNLAILREINDENLRTLKINQQKIASDAKTKYYEFGEDRGGNNGGELINFGSELFDENVLKLIEDNLPPVIKSMVALTANGISITPPDGKDKTSGYIMAYDAILEAIDKVQGRAKELGGVDLSDTPLYKSLLENQQAANELAEELENANYDYIETLFAQFKNSNGDMPDTIEEFSEWLKEFKKFANSSGDYTFGRNIDDYINEKSNLFKLDESGNVIERSAEDLVAFAKSQLESYRKTVDELLKKEETVKKAISEFNESGELTTETISGLDEAGFGAAMGVDKATGKIVLYKDKLNELINLQKQSAVSEMASQQKIISGLSEQDEETQNVCNSIERYITMLDYSGDSTSRFANILSDATDKIQEYADAYDKIVSDSSLVSAAIKEQEKYGKISGDTVKKLIDAGYKNALAYNKQTGEVVLLTDAVRNLTNEQIKNKQLEIQNEIDTVTTAIQNATKAYDSLRKSINSAWDAQMLMLYGNDIEQLNQKLVQLQEQQMIYSNPISFEDDETINKTDDETTAKTNKDFFEEKKAELDHLLAMDVIDEDEYYQKLTQLVNQYYKDKKDYLDEYRQYEEEIYKHLKQEQLNAIDEEIDRLQSVNDEKQKEIDLEEKRQALENARNQKTIAVYDSERGWIRETNRENVKNAQKDYDDAVVEQKVSELEKFKEAIENSVNVAHSDSEDVDIQTQVDSLVSIDKSILSIKDLLQKFNISYDANKLENSNALNEMVAGMANPNSFLQSAFRQNETINNNSQNINNSSRVVQVVINGDIVTSNAKDFVKQMEDIADSRFTPNFETHMNQFGKELRQYRENHR